MNDRLVADLRARRPEALDALLHEHGAEIQAVAFLILRNASDAEEVLADALLIAWRRIDTLRDADRLRPWLHRIATRLALRRRRRPRIVALSLDAAGQQVARPRDPIDRITLTETLDRLPPRMRAVVALHYVVGLSVPEIADAVDRSENTVKSQLREARARLRADLGGPAPS